MKLEQDQIDAIEAFAAYYALSISASPFAFKELKASMSAEDIKTAYFRGVIKFNQTHLRADAFDCYFGDRSIGDAHILTAARRIKRTSWN